MVFGIMEIRNEDFFGRRGGGWGGWSGEIFGGRRVMMILV